MRRRHRRTLHAIFARPVSGTIRWDDIEALLIDLGGRLEERAGSRVGVILFGEIRVFHRPHPLPETDKGAVVSIRKWLESNGVRPS
ncbi:type II toxin-antitoxin system HicA family toxin [Jiella endophytica]|uniref:Type II toxin-antitoxin system HicA family toxin n=1 Tax=Jiella endophytica TaxID=2558362 RepID=A0A4Y8RHG1_9HYPH|nr:type II toxin-antitoxin system HicA family toxin [Jiella endophytica]TFF22078.1 type II toxin-antitoxin system HicA family toxin [Jiella endophytica]